jgi:hypothetical protein
MGYAVYEMPAVREAPLSFRAQIRELIEALGQVDPREHVGKLPYFEALGQSWFKKRYEKFRLIATFQSLTVEGRDIPMVILVDFVAIEDFIEKFQGPNGVAEKIEARYGDLLQVRMTDIYKVAREWLASQHPVWQPPPPVPDKLWQIFTPLARRRVDAFFLHPNFCRAYERLTRDTERADLFRALQDIENAGSEQLQCRLTCKHNDLEVHYVRLRDSHGFNHVLLFGLISRCRDKPIQEQVKRIEAAWQAICQQVLSLPNTSKDYCDAISKLSERAFPAYILIDQELWQAVWKAEQREVFLALSSEEIYTLESLLEGTKLPAIIEGRAGSGKTTLLMYYTAERCMQQCCADARILYLTQSDKLLESATNLINRIRERLIYEVSDFTTSLKLHYKTLHQFELEQLDDYRSSRFLQRTRSGGWIDFALFSNLLRGKGPGQHACKAPFARSRDCNPEAVWFVLRSYIKGYKLGERGEHRWMTPKGYEEGDSIPSRDRQVSIELYRSVWDDIWPWYKRLTVPCGENLYQPPYWDDIDLAWELILHRSSEATNYAVIICDEVQDLTRVELAALLRSFCWIHFDIRPLAQQQGSLRLPIVLAGDAQQTINPAVFRWERVSADLADALVAHLPMLPRPKIESLELQFNYRNARSIGQLCNALQLLRQQTLGQQSRLQQLWRLQDEQPNQRVRRLIVSGKGELESLLREGVLIIGPEDDDPTLDYTEAFWRALGCRFPAENRHNYVVPAEIKGLEHDFVAIAGFGVLWQLWSEKESQLRNFWSWQNASEDQQIPEALRFFVEYFLNRLYVAVSRARDQVWIIETAKGWDAFWAQLENWATTQPSLSQERASWTTDHRDRPVNRKSVAEDDSLYAFIYSDGDINELITVFSRNWKHLAEEFERLAHEQKSPEHAERSEFYYLKAGEEIKAATMHAYKLYYAGAVFDAAKTLWDIKPRTASQWFWEAAADIEEAWQEMATRNNLDPKWLHEIAVAIVRQREGSITEALHELIRLARRSHDQSYDHAARRTWDSVYLRIVDTARRLAQEHEPLKKAALQCVETWTVTSPNQVKWHDMLGQLAYQLKDYAAAVQHWEIAKKTDHRDYFRAKASVTLYPECLQWWDSAGERSDHQQILDLYDRNAAVPLAPDDRRRVGRAACTFERWPTAFFMFAGLDNEQATRHIWPRVLESLDARQNLSLQVREFVHPIYEQFQVRRFQNEAKFRRDWTNFLIDLIAVRTENIRSPSLPQEELTKQLIEGLMVGFSLNCDPAAAAYRLREIWISGDRNDNKWTELQRYLQPMVESGGDLIRKLAAFGDTERKLQAATLCKFLLGLLWYFERREKSDSGKEGRSYISHVERHEKSEDAEIRRPYLKSNLKDYVVEAQQDSDNIVHYLKRIHKNFRDIIRDAITCISELPEDWVRNRWDDYIKLEQDRLRRERGEVEAHNRREDSGNETEAKEPSHTVWKDLSDYVEAISYDMYENLRHVPWTGNPNEDRDTFDWCMLVGKFIEQAYHRRYALLYYKELLNIAERFKLPVDQIKAIETRLRIYEKKFDEWKRQRQMQVEVYAGQRKRSTLVEISNMLDRHEAVVMFLPDLYQLRFSVSPVPRAEPVIRHDPELRILVSKSARRSNRWSVRIGDKVVELHWFEESHKLVVQADKKFIVYLGRSGGGDDSIGVAQE